MNADRFRAALAMRPFRPFRDHAAGILAGTAHTDHF
jgi:hypothetical protein